MAMIDEIDAQFIANSIIIDTFDGYYVLVEGDTDELFFSKVLDESVCQIEICHGKKNVIDALNIVNSHLSKKPKTIGIVDKDFDFLIIPNPAYPNNLLSTDYHDVEMMCFASKSFQYFANEYFSSLKVKNLLADLKINTLEDHILSLTHPISYLRIVSLQNNLNLAFKETNVKTRELDFKKFICKDKFTFKGDDALIETIRTYYNQGVKIEAEYLQSKIKELDLSKFSLLDICKGHDFTKILLIGISKRIGKTNMNSVSTEEIERSLRLSYTILDFQKTELKKKLDLINKTIVKATEIKN